MGPVPSVSPGKVAVTTKGVFGSLLRVKGRYLCASRVVRDPGVADRVGSEVGHLVRPRRGETRGSCGRGGRPSTRGPVLPASTGSWVLSQPCSFRDDHREGVRSGGRLVGGGRRSGLGPRRKGRRGVPLVSVPGDGPYPHVLIRPELLRKEVREGPRGRRPGRGHRRW